MAQTASDYLLHRLKTWGVHRIFGYPGDGINGVFGALNRAGDEFEFIQARHEEAAAFMACGHAKYTGELGVCLSTSGPGAVHMLNGLYDAKMDNQPVLAIVGQQPTFTLGSGFQQEIDLGSLYKDVAHEYVYQISNPAQVRHLVDRAVRIAKTERTVTCLIIPNDVQEMKAVETQERHHGSVFTGTDFTIPRVIPKEEDLHRAADILNKGEKVAILAGAGALGASKELAEVAGVLGAGVAKALNGITVLPDDLPYVTGAIGLVGTEVTSYMMSHCDTLLTVGSNFPYAEFLPKEGQARGIQIDIEGKRLSIRYPNDVNLVGDSAETLRALLPMLQGKEDRKWRVEIKKHKQKWRRIVEARADSDAKPINPQRVFRTVSKALSSDTIIATDCGTSTIWFARDINIQEGMMAAVSGGLSTMGNGVPYGVAAKFAHPERPVVVLAGDGAMQMLGNNELITVAKYWEKWKDPRFVVLVLNNRDLSMVTWEQRAFEGDPKYDASQEIPDVSYAAYAESLGLQGLRIEDPGEIENGIAEAFRANKPVVIDAVTDGNIPPLPPHISAEQTIAMMRSVLKGDPEAVEILRKSLGEIADGVLA